MVQSAPRQGPCTDRPGAVDARRVSVGGVVLGWSMAGHPVVEALRGARAALEAVLVRDGQGRVVGWADLGEAAPAELGAAVRLVAELEGQASGLRLHVVAAAEA